MADSGNTAHSLAALWLAFGRRLAAAAGALVALVSLLVDAPLEVAALRGAGTLAAVLVAVRAGRALLVRAEGARPADPGGKNSRMIRTESDRTTASAALGQVRRG